MLDILITVAVANRARKLKTALITALVLPILIAVLIGFTAMDPATAVPLLVISLPINILSAFFVFRKAERKRKSQICA